MKSQKVTQAAKKLADRHIYHSIRNATPGITEAIKSEVARQISSVEQSLAVKEILERIEINDQKVEDAVRDFIEAYQVHNGLKIAVLMADFVSLIENIKPIYEHYEEIEVNTNKIYDIVISHIRDIL